MGIGSPGASTITAVLQKNPTIVELAIILTEDQVENDVDALISDLCAVGTDGIPSIAPQLSGIFFACQDNTSLDYDCTTACSSLDGIRGASRSLLPVYSLLPVRFLRRLPSSFLWNLSAETDWTYSSCRERVVTTIIDEWIWHSGASG
ncbi:hypothetical protein FB451DRAFT_1409574 [Mycena latifolia]|nr:hypothetical protein FB451DRAFT_1409574 [Mycena latifolia]